MTIMKQLIESMIIGYLEESYEDDLVESIFEEVSEETWEAIEEAILNELSPELMARYADRASDDYMRGTGYDSRKKGIDTALKKLGGGSGTRKRVQKSLEGGKDAYSKERTGWVRPDRKHLDNTSQSREVHRKRGDAERSSVKSSINFVKGKRDIKDLSADEFQKKYRMTKSEWERKNK